MNAGSSNLKLSVLDADQQTLGGREADLRGNVGDDVHALLAETGPVDAVGHRVVHGGNRHVHPERVTEELVADLDRLTPLAPLHQPAALAGMAATGEVLPAIPAVACFDTAFHADLPPAASTYAVPREWRERYSLRRFGAHGLSHAYASRRAVEMTDGRATRVVVAHLGAGASLCAVADGRSVDTTMGFTPMEGLVMATRSGTVDPGMLLWLVTEAGMSAEAVTDGLDRHGGVLALAGTKDMRAVLERDDSDARLALDVYVHRLAGSIAAMTVATAGLDALVFTGGIGEAAADVRRLTCARLDHLGLEVDSDANREARPDCDVTAASARVRTLVVRAREDVEIATGVRSLLG